MPEFVLDHGNAESAAQFRALDAFTQGYIEALFFTDEEQLCEESGRDMPAVAFNLETMESRFVGGDSPGFGDLAPETLARIIADCAAFQTANAALLDSAYNRDDYKAEQAGRDFWFTRNGHGVGFWDRTQLESDTVEYEALTAEMVASGRNSLAWGAALAKRNAMAAESLGARLTTASTSFAGVDSYIGDDGKVYLA